MPAEDPSPRLPQDTATQRGSLRRLTREVEDFVAAQGWDQSPQLFALVPTAELLAQQPELANQVDETSALTPVAQEALPSDDLAETLATITWPATVRGAALVQEIVVLPPEAEHELAPAGEDDARTRAIAASHPRRREARLVAVVVRDGEHACALRLRGDGTGEEIVEDPDLAPNLTRALLATLRE